MVKISVGVPVHVGPKIDVGIIKKKMRMCKRIVFTSYAWTMKKVCYFISQRFLYSEI
jgi:hypothetical protein